MTSFTSRYGNPAHDFRGAHIWAQERHGCTVLTVSGRIDGANVDDILEWARPLSAGAPNLVLDLSSVTVCTPNCIRLLREIDALCAKRNGQWALVAGDAVRHRLRSRDGSLSVPLADSVAQAEHHFDDAVTARRRLVLPLLGRTA